MLQKSAHWNDFTPEFRKRMDDKISKLGKKVTYKFNISRPNPDPEKYNGAILWPGVYTLVPKTFNIPDEFETDRTKSKSKVVGIVLGTDEKGLPNKYGAVKIQQRYEGKITLDTENPEDLEFIMYLELHPKHKGGDFEDKDKSGVFERVDKKKEAVTERAERKARDEARDIVKGMKEEDMREFASAMMWDETDDIDILMNRVEKMAEESPAIFNDLIKSKKIEYQSIIKKALDKQVITVSPMDGRFFWGANNVPIALLGVNTGNESDVQRFAEWIMSSPKGDEIFKKIKSLLK